MSRTTGTHKITRHGEEEIRAFIEAVRSRQEPLVSGREGLRAVELAYRVLACVQEELRRSG